MIRMLCSGSVAFTATSASARTRRRAYGSFTSASRAWRVAVLPRDFRARDGHREAGRCPDRDHERDARDGGFLQDLEAASPAHREDRSGQGSPTREERLPDDLVDRVVSPDVLAQTRELTRGVEQSRRVEPSRLGEQRLVFSEPLRNRGDRLWVERGLARRNRMTDGDADGLKGGLPADAARRSHVEVAREAVRAELHVGPEDGAYDVVLLGDAGIRAVLDSRDVPLAGYDSLGEQEPRGQFEIVAGRAHRHRQGDRLSLPLRAALHADLHRFLRRELVRLLTRAGTAHLPHRGGRRWSWSLHGRLPEGGTGSIRTRAL